MGLRPLTTSDAEFPITGTRRFCLSRVRSVTRRAGLLTWICYVPYSPEIHACSDRYPGEDGRENHHEQHLPKLRRTSHKRQS
jgi:hypothetical protein